MSISTACRVKDQKQMVARLNPSRSYNRRMSLCHNRMDRNSAYNLLGLLGHVVIGIYLSGLASVYPSGIRIKSILCTYFEVP